MRKKILSFMLPVLWLSAASCDDGYIPENIQTTENQGYVALLSGELKGLGSWNDKYTVSLAAFTDQSDYAVVQKQLPTTDGAISLTLSNIPNESTQVALCITNTLRKRIATLASIEIDKHVGDTIRLEVKSMDVGLYNTIQQQLFNSACTACHGNSTTAAADLYLTDNKSYGNLVNIQSKKSPDKMRVAPGDAENSLLYQALASEISTEEGWHYNHRDILTNEHLLTWIYQWINNGATAE